MMWITGIQTVRAYLKNQPKFIKRLYFSKQLSDVRRNSILMLAEQHGVSIQWVEKKRMNSKQSEKVFFKNYLLEQGIGAECADFHYYSEKDLLQFAKPDALILLLDGIQDPHNLGACLRTADAVGTACVVIPKDKSVGVTQVVAKVASGATASVPIVRVKNLVRAIKLLQSLGFWLYGTAATSNQSIYEMNFKQGANALVMGSEGKGLRQLVQSNCDALVSIPMCGAIESLNVSVATAVCLYEIKRQQH